MYPRSLRFEEFPQEDRVTVRLRHGDRERFSRVAEQHGMSLSGLLREGAEVVIAALSEDAPPSAVERLDLSTTREERL